MKLFKDETTRPVVDTRTIGAKVLKGQRQRFRHLGPILVAGAARRYQGRRIR